MAKKWRIAGINFDHFHMGDLLRIAHEHSHADIVAVCDARLERMQPVVDSFNIQRECVFTDYRKCLEQTQPDVVILCPATADHANWTEKIAPYDVHILIEKPFASSLQDADRMIAAMKPTGKQLAVNWPLRWYPSHATSHRIISEGQIGDVVEVHYYDGNRGPLWHGADKVQREPTAVEKNTSWFYKAAAGGGSLLDYLGYGTTLGTWYHGNRKPSEVMCMVDTPEGLEVDEHSVTVARYDVGLSTFETRWGTFSDPWIHQPQPKCGFVIKGTSGTISSYDYEPTIKIQTPDCVEGREFPVDTLSSPNSNPVEYFLDRLESGQPVEGPLSLPVSRIGQQIVDTAFQSARQKRALTLIR